MRCLHEILFNYFLPKWWASCIKQLNFFFIRLNLYQVGTQLHIKLFFTLSFNNQLLNLVIAHNCMHATIYIHTSTPFFHHFNLLLFFSYFISTLHNRFSDKCFFSLQTLSSQHSQFFCVPSFCSFYGVSPFVDSLLFYIIICYFCCIEF